MPSFLILVLVAACFTTFNRVSCRFVDPAKEWNLFKEKFDKIYDNQNEEEMRMKFFLESAKDIEEHNKLFAEGKVSYKKAINEFSDMPFDEFIKNKGGLNASLRKRNPTSSNKLYSVNSLQNDTDVTIPETKDWREEGAVTPVKNQKNCGSCWAFSAVGALEGQLFLKSGRLIRLSEQNLVDCSREFGNYGCAGGWMDWAFDYVRYNEGIAAENHYPYEGRNGICRYMSFLGATSLSKYVDLPEGDEEELKKAVALEGPVSIAFNVMGNFQWYSEGVYYEENCDPEGLNHGMLAVGYGTTEAGEDYWLVKNSWGTSWGDNGYIKVARNKNNTCGIASVSSYPII